MWKWIRKFLVKLLTTYGRFGASQASVHGIYEPKVPDALKH